jgi:hypothetical protein
MLPVAAITRATASGDTSWNFAPSPLIIPSMRAWGMRCDGARSSARVWRSSS